MARYRIKNMGRGFDGLVVEARPEAECEVRGRTVLVVDKIINNDVVFGDRNIAFPVPGGALFINVEFLEQLDEAPKEFSSDNPFGSVVTERKYVRGQLEVTLVEHEHSLNVTIREVKKQGDSTVSRTVYSQNFSGRTAAKDLAEEAVDECLEEDRLDELVFVLKRIEKNMRETNNG